MVLIDKAFLRGYADSLDSVKNELDIVEGGMVGIKNATAESWQSGYTDYYLERYEEVHTKVIEALDAIRTIQRNLRSCANRAETAERETKARLDAILNNTMNDD